MQSLRLKLRKRKYKLSLSRGVGGGGDRDGPTAFTNAGSEWEFENFSPWIFTAKPCDTKEEDEEADDDDDEEAGYPQDDEDVKYWGPRPMVQGLVHHVQANPLPPPPSHPPPPPPPPPVTAAGSSATPPRYGILSYFPRRPSSWSPTSTAPPPIPPHAWQIRRRATARAGRIETNGRANSPPPPLPPPKNRPISASHTDLKRSASCYQEPRDAARLSDSLSDLRPPAVEVHNGSSSWGTRAANRLKRVQSELSSDPQQLLLLRRPRTSAYTKLEPTYCAPYRCRSTNEVRPLRPLRKQSASLRHNGLMSTLASSESHLSGSYTLLSDDIDRLNRPSPSSPPPAPPHRSSPPPPPVPPHAPGVLCTRIAPTSPVPVYAVVLRNRPAGDKQSGLGSNGRSFNDGSKDGARDRRSGTGSGSDSFGEADRRAGYTPPYEEELDR
ncbi:hypothetical protein OUZ56_000723 [Daphnia magna]|uniref:Uncharacterized protein n=1 Tax=Daphnia magna TaxID=35525 RepID=A0ABR0A0J9_9CRUS|nr:hypothetical protein OUZ56_000723 [Daphnia magna]